MTHLERKRKASGCSCGGRGGGAQTGWDSEPRCQEPWLRRAHPGPRRSGALGCGGHYGPRALPGTSWALGASPLPRPQWAAAPAIRADARLEVSQAPLTGAHGSQFPRPSCSEEMPFRYIQVLLCIHPVICVCACV